MRVEGKELEMENAAQFESDVFGHHDLLLGHFDHFLVGEDGVAASGLLLLEDQVRFPHFLLHRRVEQDCFVFTLGDAAERLHQLVIHPTLAEKQTELVVHLRMTDFRNGNDEKVNVHIFRACEN